MLPGYLASFVWKKVFSESELVKKFVLLVVKEGEE